ncbi:hypothetical protein AAEH93_21795, partial [Shewanella xiamenensis]
PGYYSPISCSNMAMLWLIYEGILQRYVCPCDSYGVPTGEWQRVINGVYFNHGSNEQPNWSVHT